MNVIYARSMKLSNIFLGAMALSLSVFSAPPIHTDGIPDTRWSPLLRGKQPPPYTADDYTPVPTTIWHDRQPRDHEADRRARIAELNRGKTTLLDVLRGPNESDRCAESLWRIVNELRMDKRCQADRDTRSAEREMMDSLDREDRRAYRKLVAGQARASRLASKEEKKAARMERKDFLSRLYRQAKKIYRSRLRKARKPKTSARSRRRACRRYRRCRDAEAAAESGSSNGRRTHVPGYCPQVKVAEVAREGMPCDGVCGTDIQDVLDFLLDDVWADRLDEVEQDIFESRGGDAIEVMAYNKFKDILREATTDMIGQEGPACPGQERRLISEEEEDKSTCQA
ncbi:hypothetical protein GMORB2_2557 [Geosmithia morbida]|uniref:Uncharacterized protein n=1 Tax=Geosmithia morbida TaxID=1094350 RepID=A0A9P4YQ51_9HYPO|nr:uncharacterized protein GMORB2_2557 [Geosmithia morbida]KAF4121071.1 hypothetical protein GMORB2_2557 [Geosmithia morbida]